MGSFFLGMLGPLLKPLAGLVLNWIVSKFEGDKADAEIKKIVLEFIDKLQEKGVVKRIELSDAVTKLEGEMENFKPEAKP